MRNFGEGARADVMVAVEQVARSALLVNLRPDEAQGLRGKSEVPRDLLTGRTAELLQGLQVEVAQLHLVPARQPEADLVLLVELGDVPDPTRPREQPRMDERVGLVLRRVEARNPRAQRRRKETFIRAGGSVWFFGLVGHLSPMPRIYERSQGRS